MVWGLFVITRKMFAVIHIDTRGAEMDKFLDDFCGSGTQNIYYILPNILHGMTFVLTLWLRKVRFTEVDFSVSEVCFCCFPMSFKIHSNLCG